ncbi:MAG: PAS domain S-box protein, partial [Flavobacteriales bacterium]
MNQDIRLLERALERERAARKAAERLLTEKSMELFSANERLRKGNEELERLVLERTNEVRKAERRWRFALTGTGDGVWEIDTHDWSVFYSSGFKRMLGFKENEMADSYEAWRDRAHPDDLPRIFRIFEQYVAGEIVTHSIEYRVLHRDGTYRWMLDRGMVLEYDAQGNTRRIIGTHTDIHHLKTVEMELERSNDRLATLIANMQTAILVEDPQRRILLTNRSFCEMFGIPAEPEHMVGFDCAAAAEQTAALFVGPEAFIARIDVILQARELVINERLQMVDGRVLERTFIPVEHKGEYLGHLWKYMDVTARVTAEETLRRREEKYRSIIANMNLGLIEVDLEERIRYVNQSFLQMSGFTAEELIGKVASDLFLSPEDRPQMEERNKSRSEGVSSAYELRTHDRHGEVRWWLVSGAPRYDDHGRLQGSIGIHLDITERKGLEEELLRAKSIAEKNAQAKEVFLAHMSHEIRTPMNAIMGLGRELARSELAPTQRMHVEAINTASDNLLVIINNILDSSKMEAGKLVLQHTGFHVADTMKQVERVLSHRAKQKGLAFATTADPGLPSVLLGDPYRLNQVLFNIAGNAVKFTERGSVIVSATTFAAQDGA